MSFDGPYRWAGTPTPAALALVAVDGNRKLYEIPPWRRGVNLTITGVQSATEPFHVCGDNSCPSCDDGAHVFQANVGAIDVYPTADYYTVEVNVQGPWLGGAQQGCQVVVELTPEGFREVVKCGSTPDRAFYDGSFVGPTLTPQWLTDDGQATSTAFASVTDGNSASPAFWPATDLVVAPNLPALRTGFLINPNTNWPVPDDVGNTFGRCLFTRAQLPTGSITMTITRHSHHQTFSGLWGVLIRGYLIERQSVSTVVVGPGSAGWRRRERIVGQGGKLLRVG